jgi:hypothetical protein
MKMISVSVSKSDYEAFRKAAEEADRSIAQLIREAMALYRSECIETRTPLRELPIIAGHHPIGKIPGRDELYEEIFNRQEGSD